ncbi:HEAT repeat domain-containing protein, partial [bacterium]|nr:HEAT repeat domain-containing protein [bacterium]
MKNHRIILLTICFLFLLSPGLTLSQEDDPISHLDQALFLANISRADCSISEPWESGYIIGGRMPALVDSLANPFYLPSFTQVFGGHFSGSRGSVSPVELLDNTFEMLNLDISMQKSVKTENMSLVDALEQLQTTHHRGLIKPEYRESLAIQIETWPTELQEAVTILVQSFTQASLERQKAMELLSRDDIETLVNDLKKWVVLPGVSNGNLFLAGVDDKWPTNLQLLRKIDYSHLFYASRIMAEAIEVTRSRLQAAMLKIKMNGHEEILLEFHSAAGTILIGGTGINRYEKDAALLIDLGGNDTYRNNAGGFIDSFDGICCLIDMEGNDSYESLKPGSLGGAFCGVSILVDYDGHDVYRSGCVSQGAAFCGVGMLYDESGDDTWIGSWFTQGAAAFGIGLAVDVGGNDAFICRSIGQGFATTLGTGILVNVAGDDTYSAGPIWDDRERMDMNVSVFAQGAGVGFHSMDKFGQSSLYGGIGFLVDGRGDDQYLAGNFSQGASRFGAMGLLLDGSGNDGYQATNNSQGAAMDWSSACLIDQRGNDWYLANDTVQGSAVNHSSGFLLDYDGDDKYELTGSHGQGHGREVLSLGLMIDYRGYDKYEGGPFTRGFAVCSLTETEKATGIFLDHRGNDTYGSYPSSLAKNNSIWQRSSDGTGIDTPDVPEMYFARERALSRHQHYDMSPVTDLEKGVNTSRLGSIDPYISFHALAPVILHGADSIPVMVKAMQRGHDSFRRIMEEGIDQIMLADKTTEKWDEMLSSLLQNLDPSTRQWCLLRLLRTGNPSLADIIRPLLTDNDAEVRRVAVQTISRMQDNKSDVYLRHMALHDPEPATRLTALNALGKHEKKENISVFRESLIDSCLAVHSVAGNWVEHFNDLDSVGTLQLLASNSDRRIGLSAAKSLIKLGEKSGFPILIDALETKLSFQSPHDQSEPLIEFLKEHSGQQYPWDAEI